MSRAVTRRTALRGSVATSLGLLAGVASVQAAPILSTNDRRLVELADAYEALDQRCSEHMAAHRHDHSQATNAEFDVLTEGFSRIEAEIAATPADTMAGVLAKARACQVPTMRHCAEEDVLLSAADDLWHLHATGRLAHA